MPRVSWCGGATTRDTGPMRRVRKEIEMIRRFLLGAALLSIPALAEVRVFRNFTLIDGTGRPPAAGSAMIVENGRIKWIGGDQDVKAPPGAEIVSLGGAYLMPGII